jgi:xylulokinase
MGHPNENYIASDGGSNSRIWMGIVADVLQRPVQRLNGHPGSCLGAAWTAAIGSGLAADWSGISGFVTLGERLMPNPRNAALYAEGYRAYRELFNRLKTPLTNQSAPT